MNGKYVAVLVALCLCAAPLRAQDARLVERLPAEAVPSVTERIDAARAQGLPTEPLVQRALEGVNRGATPLQIEAAVGELADRLAVARSALGSGRSEAELVAAAGALDAGLSEAELREMRNRSAGRSLALPLVILADLAERGVPAGTASSVILAMVDAGTPGNAYTTLQQLVAQDIRAGASPRAAAETRAAGILLGRPDQQGRTPLDGRGGARPAPRPNAFPGASPGGRGPARPPPPRR